MNHHQTLFEILPERHIVDGVTKAFERLNAGLFGNIPLSTLNPSKQVICGLFHELIVRELALHAGWREGKPKIEADLVHDSGLQLQLKTSSSLDGIAGNRYSSQNEYSDPSEHYICVNFIPFVSITKIRAGFLPASSWKPQRGKGNAATVKKEVLDALPFLGGDYLSHMPLYAVKGIGTKLYESFTQKGLSTLQDIRTSEQMDLVRRLAKKEEIIRAIEVLLHLQYAFLKPNSPDKPIAYLKLG